MYSPILLATAMNVLIRIVVIMSFTRVWVWMVAAELVMVEEEEVSL